MIYSNRISKLIHEQNLTYDEALDLIHKLNLDSPGPKITWILFIDHNAINYRFNSSVEENNLFDKLLRIFKLNNFL